MFMRPGNRGMFMPGMPMQVNHEYSTVIIPHLHPVHGITVHHQRIIHEHYFPHQHSSVGNIVYHHHLPPRN
ncbi:hypothetical protein D1B31_10215 [Neobacillus notoginsengisoli]|uniref:Spore coat protein n=1 Tax=Neobacillus notoginsengisoli TaxID=1578198 RepID=A0A417YVH3_9BACI|nr:CotD family spore coat protein [Neobacillus notoginsengisoli]RHW41296.1 hypothetical protein D1B31_10215 [Neobacillus notoginsengisoli]